LQRCIGVGNTVGRNGRDERPIEECEEEQCKINRTREGRGRSRQILNAVNENVFGDADSPLTTKLYQKGGICH
jgi:hypothetical protein